MIYLAPSLELANDLAQRIHFDVTVEAEYGDHVVEGFEYTAAHHAPSWKHRPAPCNDGAIPYLGSSADILVSHIDLDTVGGCLRVIGDCSLRRELFERESFWHLAERVDVSGPHKVRTFRASNLDINRLYAFWSWSKITLVPKAMSKVSDVTMDIEDSGEALRLILSGDPMLLQGGRAFRFKERELDKHTFQRMDGCVVVRIAQSAGDFCNHLYACEEGIGRGVVTYNEEKKAITISVAEPGVNCCALVQQLWGDEAGGHVGAAGSPRGQDVSGDLERAVLLLKEALGACDQLP